MASLQLSPSRHRVNVEVWQMRQNIPYVNYASSLVLPHAHPDPPIIYGVSKKTPEDCERTSTWREGSGWGSRHKHDTAPSTLWEPESRTFRSPTSNEKDWIMSTYRATGINVILPELIIATETPPDPVPLTVAGVSVTFVKPAAPTSDRPYPVIFHPLPVHLTTNYVHPRNPDPMKLRIHPSQNPTLEELHLIWSTVCDYCHPRCISILDPYIVIELYLDGREYKAGSLPRRFAGFAAIYHHQEKPIFTDVADRARERLIKPTAAAQDGSDYLSHWGALCPSVRLDSARFTIAGKPGTFTRSTSAGPKIRNTNGEVRIMAANHEFLSGDDVYHPKTTTGRHIGRIDERFKALDVALIKLDNAAAFQNNPYFEAKPMAKLLRYNEVKNGAWYCCDGMSSGAIFLQARGVQLLDCKRPEPGPGLAPVKLDFNVYLINRTFGVTAPVVRDGVCGAPIVEDDETGAGGVVGIFYLASNDFAFTAVLDELIDRGWSLCE